MAVQVNVKRPGEIRIGTFDFALFPEVSGGDNLSSVTGVSVTPSGLTVGSPSLSGTVVSALLTGGTDGVTYTLTATAVTVSAKTLQCVGQLLVVSS